MATHLRLHTELPSLQPTEEIESPTTYQFPAAMAEARRTLVAGVVNVPAIPEPSTRARHIPRCSVLAHIENGVDCTTDTDRLMRQVECTLEEMQDKLDTLKEDVDQVFKFPIIEDDDRPWAA